MIQETSSDNTQKFIGRIEKINDLLVGKKEVLFNTYYGKNKYETSFQYAFFFQTPLNLANLLIVTFPQKILSFYPVKAADFFSELSTFKMNSLFADIDK